MNKLLALVIAATAVMAGSASAQTPTSPPYAPLTTDIMAKTPYSAYVQDGRGVIARDPFGLCWRTGYWTPADAVPGCDLPICTPPETLQDGKCVAPPPPPPPPPPPVTHYSCPNQASTKGHYIPAGKHWGNDFTAKGSTTSSRGPAFTPSAFGVAVGLCAYAASVRTSLYKKVGS
ncbi:MAG: hypothetical protein ACXU8N_00935 [Telluria sp.]